MGIFTNYTSIDDLTGHLQDDVIFKGQRELIIRGVDVLGTSFQLRLASDQPLVMEALGKIGAVLDELKKQQVEDKNNDSGAIQAESELPNAAGA